MESPTLLHTLNADVQGLLSERLLENTFDQLQKYPVYLLEHRMNGKVKELACYCLGADPKSSLFRLISHLVVESQAPFSGFSRILVCSHLVPTKDASILAKLYAKRLKLIEFIKTTTKTLQLVPLDHASVFSWESWVFALLLMRTKTNGMERHCPEFNFEYAEFCRTNGHEMLYPFLEVEDLIDLLNRPGENHSVLFQRLALPLHHI